MFRNLFSKKSTPTRHPAVAACRPSAPHSPEPLPEKMYIISLGDVDRYGVGAVMRIFARSQEEAVTRAKKLANLHYEGFSVICHGDFGFDWIESVRLYLSGKPISVKHIEDYGDLWALD